MPTSIEIFNRLGKGTKSTPAQPEPPFPRIPAAIKAKFPDLAQEWENYEKEIEIWQKKRQTI